MASGAELCVVTATTTPPRTRGTATAPALPTRSAGLVLLRLMILHKPRRHRRKTDVATATCAQRVNVDLRLLDKPVIRHVL